MFARFSKFETRLDNPNWGGTIAVPSDNGGIMDALNAAVDVLWMPNPRTTVDFRFGSSYVEDDYASAWAQQVPTSVWASFWPNSNWYKGVLQPSQGIYYPNFNFSGNGSSYTGIGNWWLVHGRSHNPTVNVTHDRGIHHMKAGWQLRYSYDQDNANSGPGGLDLQLHRYRQVVPGLRCHAVGQHVCLGAAGCAERGDCHDQPQSGHAPAAVGLLLPGRRQAHPEHHLEPRIAVGA